MANKTIKEPTVQQRVDQLKTNLSDFHDEALRATDKMVELSLASGAQWQKLMSRVLHKGTDLLERQQDIALNTLEAAMGQYEKGNKRFIQLLGIDQTKAKKAARLRKESHTGTSKDDLKVLQGIGPKIESILNNAGINSLEELANTSIESLQAILKDAGSRYQSIDPTAWVALAQEIVTKGNDK
ncbi:MAG: hypothetical protein AAF694_16620 [Bacteroidota bacterium]